MDIAALPFVDEHATVVEAEADAVRRGIGDALDGAFTPGWARLVGCPDRTASGPRPLAVGSTVPGFRVAATDHHRELVLVGRHHFSTYALVFRIERAGAGRTRLSAETRAGFPGPFGRLYRLLVIGSGAHAVLTRRLLSSIRGHAERVR